MQAEMTEIVMPTHTNHLGTCFGGTIMSWIDTVAAIAAQRAAGMVVTASVDSIQFKEPIQLGDVVTLRAAVNKIWNSSMEVGVKIVCQTPVEIRAAAIDEPTHTILSEEYQACRAYLTFVAVDNSGKRRTIKKSSYIPVYCDAADIERRLVEAEKRRKVRLASK